MLGEDVEPRSDELIDQEFTAHTQGDAENPSTGEADDSFSDDDGAPTPGGPVVMTVAAAIFLFIYWLRRRRKPISRTA